jgi:glycerol uptake facilitator-like aquaporin
MKFFHQTLLLFLAVFVIFCINQSSCAENPYRVLGVAPYHSMSHIKSVYKNLAKKHHPDKTKDKSEEARKKFYRIQAAYEQIKEMKGHSVNSATMEDYDDEGSSDISKAAVDCISTMLLYLLVLYTVYYSMSFIMWVVDYTFNFGFFYSIIAAITDYFCSHLFDSTEAQHTTVFLLTVSLVMIKRKLYPAASPAVRPA